MLFSILIAHYQNWIFFQDCYQSIVNQTYQNFEIIIVDDCSQDDSYEKLVELAKQDKRIKVYRNEENKGVGYTKNRCIQLATGDICGFVDPDDSLVNDALESILNSYSKNENFVGVYGKMLLCTNELVPLKVFNRAARILNKDPLFVNISTNIAHFFTFKREVYNKTEKINVDLKIAEDQDLYLKIYEKGDIYFLNKVLYNYRLHHNGLSQGENKGKNDFKKVIRRAMERRGVKKISGIEIENISNNELYELLAKRENSFWFKLNKRLKQLI